jgi:hypothetical protein
LPAARDGDVKDMPNPLNTLTKPLQIGARIAMGAFGQAAQAVQGLTGGGQDDAPPQQDEKQQEEQQQGPPPRQRRNTQAKPLADTTIKAKIESELFRSQRVDKGKIDVNVVDGVAFLRGEAKTPEQIKDLGARAEKIPEVKSVENLLHLPKTPAPTRADTPPAQQKTRRTKPASARKSPKKPPVSSERKTTAAKAEPTPKDVAKSGRGRQAAPLGSTGEGSTPGASEAAAKPAGATPPAAATPAEPTPKEAAASGKGRQPAPLGSNGDSGSTGS